jgi:hypothetical protein
MPILIHEELRHRGEPLVAYPGADLWKAVGGSDGVTAARQSCLSRPPSRLLRCFDSRKGLRGAPTGGGSSPHEGTARGDPVFASANCYVRTDNGSLSVGGSQL